MMAMGGAKTTRTAQFAPRYGKRSRADAIEQPTSGNKKRGLLKKSGALYKAPIKRNPRVIVAADDRIGSRSLVGIAHCLDLQPNA